MIAKESVNCSKLKHSLSSLLKADNGCIIEVSVECPCLCGMVDVHLSFMKNVLV